jgi:hypothetical protein
MADSVILGKTIQPGLPPVGCGTPRRRVPKANHTETGMRINGTFYPHHGEEEPTSFKKSEPPAKAGGCGINN